MIMLVKVNLLKKKKNWKYDSTIFISIESEQ